MRAAPLFLLYGSMTAFSPGQTTAFEVASIKPSAPAMIWSGFRPSAGGRFEASHVTVKAMVGFAYDARDFQISGGPSWASSDRYDILAKAPESTSTTQLREAMQALLKQRLKLALRRETRQLTVYELTAARGGAKLHEATTGSGFLRFVGKGQIEVSSYPMRQFALYLSTLLDRMVIDKTGLASKYDFTLKWTPDEAQSGKPGAQGEVEGGGASIFTALQEQLGLKLESSKAPVETFLIDQVERPSED